MGIEVSEALVSAIGSRRVIPAFPAGREGRGGDADDCNDDERDEIAGWATFICYVNAKDEYSERRISCHRLEGYGRPEVVRAYCHEDRRPKSFRIDRIQELIDYRTGECADPVEHFGKLHLHGLIDMNDLVEIWRSKPIPEGPIVLRKALPDYTKSLMTGLMASLKTRDADCAYSVMAGDAQGFQPITHAAYEIIIEARKRKSK